MALTVHQCCHHECSTPQVLQKKCVNSRSEKFYLLNEGDRFSSIQILWYRLNPIRSQMETVLDFWMDNVLSCNAKVYLKKKRFPPPLINPSGYRHTCLLTKKIFRFSLSRIQALPSFKFSILPY